MWASWGTSSPGGVWRPSCSAECLKRDRRGVGRTVAGQCQREWVFVEVVVEELVSYVVFAFLAKGTEAGERLAGERVGRRGPRSTESTLSYEMELGRGCGPEWSSLGLLPRGPGALIGRPSRAWPPGAVYGWRGKWSLSGRPSDCFPSVGCLSGRPSHSAPLRQANERMSRKRR